MNRGLLLISGFLIFFTACKSTRQITSTSTLKKIDKIIEGLDKNQLQFEWLSAKARITIDNKSMKQSATLHLRIRNDSLIWGSVTYLFGIEVARFYIDQKNITVINKLKKQYYQYPLSYIEDEYGIPDIDFRFLQNLITGNSVYNLNKGFSPKSFEENLILTRLDKGTSKNVIINIQELAIQQYQVEKVGSNQKVEVRYSGKIEDKNKGIPENVEIIVFLPEKNLFTLNFSSLQLNKAFSVNASIPKGYVKVD